MLLTPEDEGADNSREGHGSDKGDGGHGDEEKKEKGKEGIERFRKALGYYFPEYRELNQTLQRDQPRPRPRRGKRPRTAKETVGPLIPFTPASLLADPTLSLLGGLVLEREARARVKGLKKEIDSHSPPPPIQNEYTSRRRLYKQTSSFLTPSEKERGLRGMVTTALREMAEAGEIVQVRLETAFTPFLDARATHPDNNTTDTSAYLPLPPPLLFPLLVPLLLSLQSQSQSQSQSLHKHRGRLATPIPTIKLTNTLTQWGKDGRWERTTLEIVQAGMHWAQERGWVDKREGMICKCKHLIRGLLSRRPSALSGFV